MSDYVGVTLGPQFAESSAADLGACYTDSSPATPLIFVLSQGSDPTAALLQFACALVSKPKQGAS
jgi:dynein heavy chain, axonemal